MSTAPVVYTIHVYQDKGTMWRSERHARRAAEAVAAAKIVVAS